MTDIPPEPDEDWMPPLNTLRWRVEFYLQLRSHDRRGILG